MLWYCIKKSQMQHTIQQDRQCVYDVTWSRVRVTNVALESKKFHLRVLWSCVCSLSYPAWAAHTPYFIIFCLSSVPDFPTLSHKRQPFRKKRCWTWNVYFDFLYNFCLKYRVFQKSFTTLKAYRNLYRGHTQGFELSKCSKTHRVLLRIVMVQCDFHW